MAILEFLYMKASDDNYANNYIRSLVYLQKNKKTSNNM